MYNEGLARFATEPYSLSRKSLSKKYIHLTNFSVNKNSPSFVKNQNTDSDGNLNIYLFKDFGSKWSHSAIKRKYQ